MQFEFRLEPLRGPVDRRPVPQRMAIVNSPDGPSTGQQGTD
ncbi:MAG: hypothetical protein OXI22_00285 [Defluviicoccus sp.]|nr:hypothetical protein [Defluviicoccus sp.]